MKLARQFVFALLFFTPFLLFSQKYTIKGTLIDSTEGPIVGATVMLLQPKDSSLLAFSRSDENGFFDFKNQSSGEYLLRCTYFGYNTLQQKLNLEGSNTTIDLGTMKMEVKSNLLNEVQISGESNPVTIRNDTIEFNAGSFKVKDNAVVEDLLKKLPGVEVGGGGSLREMGEEVERVTVDGKEFFGKDPKLATQNLPADAIDKVQVFDKKSDRAEFSGIDDGQREKTLNLSLKEDSYFGRVNAGYGNQGRYKGKGKGNLNRFTPGEQCAILGMANNVNEPGFSLDEYIEFMGGLQGSNKCSG